MPVVELGRRAAPRFAVVAKRAASRTVVHCGLLAADLDVAAGETVPVFHIGPPLQVGGAEGSEGRIEDPRLVAWIDDLTDRERRGMEAWLEDVQTRRAGSVREDYVIDPPVSEVVDPTTGRGIRRRYSCVGLVLDCYLVGARIRLLRVESGRLPGVTAAMIELAFGYRTAVLERLGLLRGPGPWPIVRPGFLIHALARANPRAPYAPKAGDERYPR